MREQELRSSLAPTRVIRVRRDLIAGMILSAGSPPLQPRPDLRVIMRVRHGHALNQRPLFGMHERSCAPARLGHIALICMQPSGEITNGATEQDGGSGSVP
jgi:hypothetical protein